MRLNKYFSEIFRLEELLDNERMLQSEAGYFGDYETAGLCEDQIRKLERKIRKLRKQWAASPEDWVGTF